MSQMLLGNVAWNNTNTQRNYPLDDRAHRIASNGTQLPLNLISDAGITVPYGHAFIASVNVSPAIVTVVIGWYEEFPDVSSIPITPGPRIVGVVTAQRPIQPYQNYQITSMMKEAGGWITFGTDAELPAPASWRFDDVKASFFLQHVVFVRGDTETSGVPWMTRIGSTPLTGVVTLSSRDSDVMRIVKRRIDTGVEDVGEVDAISFELNEEESGPEVFARFLGPCGALPESDTCRGQQIKSLNGVRPDCDGLITIFVQESWSPGGSPDLVLSTANNGTDEPERPDSEVHTINFDYARGLSVVCKPNVMSSFANDSADSCDIQCDPRGFTEPSPLEKICYSVQTGHRKEPFYEEGRTFLWLSEIFEIDVTGMTDITFKTESDDFFFMIPFDSAVSQTPLMTVYAQVADENPPVTFNVPEEIVFFQDSHGWVMNEEFTGRQGHAPASAEKTFDDGTNDITYPAGDSGNNGTGHADGALTTAGFTLRDARGDGWVATIADLTTLGYIYTEDDRQIFRARCGHVVSGAGFGRLEIYCSPPAPTESVDDAPAGTVRRLSVGVRNEPFYDGGTDFLFDSGVIEIDVTGMTNVTFEGESEDILMIIPENSQVIQDPPIAEYQHGDPVTFVVPDTRIIFGQTTGFMINQEEVLPDRIRSASCQKTIRTSGPSFISRTYAAGTAMNHGTGTTAQLVSSGFTITAFGTVFSISSLTSSGYVVDNVLRFRLVHIVGGTGYGRVDVVVD